MTDTIERDRLAGAREQAQAQFDSIKEMVARLNAAEDDDAYADMAEDLAREAGYALAAIEDDRTVFYHYGKDGTYDDTEFETEADAWFAACEDNGLRPDYDEARQAIEENALSVQVRSGWYSPGEKGEPEEYEILLCTGGPAVRIVGDLGMHNQPDLARLECQDWFTPWTEVFDGIDQSILLDYARVFYFGE